MVPAYNLQSAVIFNYSVLKKEKLVNFEAALDSSCELIPGSYMFTILSYFCSRKFLRGHVSSKFSILLPFS